MKFSHFIVTRFNVKVKSWNIRHEVVVNPEWLSARFDLFERFCFPSVRAQENDNFRWLVLFDTETPQFFREQIRRYALWDRFVPRFIDYFDAAVVQEAIHQLLPDDTTHVITTRIDNDDAIGRYFVGNVQRHFRGQDFTFLNFPNGYILDEKRRKLYRFKHTSNPYISLVEKRPSDATNLRTVWIQDHDRLCTVSIIQQIDIEPQWLRVVHGGNLRNTVGLHQRVSIRALVERFVLDYPIDSVSENPISIFLDNGICAARWLVRKSWSAARKLRLVS